MDQDLQAVVFDVDGTLADSERDGHRVAFNQAFEALDLPYRWEPEPYGELLLITGGERRIATFLEDEGVPEPERSELARKLHKKKTELFQELIDNGQVPARPGALRLVDALTAEGVRLAVATTGSRAWVDPLLERLFGRDRFEVVITGDEAPDRKPDPSAYLQAVEAMGLQPGPDVVAVEDSSNGLVAAKAADLSCVVVVNDYTRDHDFSDADLVVDGFGPEEPTKVLSDPLDLAPESQLEVETLRLLAARRRSAGRA